MHVQGLLWVGSFDSVAWGVPAGELAAGDTHTSVTLESSYWKFSFRPLEGHSHQYLI